MKTQTQTLFSYKLIYRFTQIIRFLGVAHHFSSVLLSLFTVPLILVMLLSHTMLYYLCYCHVAERLELVLLVNHHVDRSSDLDMEEADFES